MPSVTLQLSLSFADDEPVAREPASDQVVVRPGITPLAIPAMAQLDDTPLSPPAAKVPRSAAPKTAKPRKATSGELFAPDPKTVAEVDRLLTEGLLIRYAGLQRRFKLRGPLTFTAVDAPALPASQGWGDLVPKFLKKQPTGWTLTDEGYVYALKRADAAEMAKRINAQRDDLGVFHCERVEGAWRLVFEF